LKSIKVLSTVVIASQLLLGLSTFSSAEQSDLHLSELNIYGGLATAENPIGQPDRNLALSLDDGQTWGPVYLAGSSSHSRGYGFRSGTNSWLNCNSDPSPCPGNSPETIRSSFTLPDHFSNLQVTLDVLVDDVGYFSLNGNQFWVGGIEAKSFDLTSFAKTGINNLDVKVVNGPGEVGINFRYALSALTNGDILQNHVKYSNYNFPTTPRIVGNAEVGQSLEAQLNPPVNDATFKYQWLRNDDEIVGQTSSSYSASQLDIGKTIQVRVEIVHQRYPSQIKLSDKVFVEDPSTKQVFTITGGQTSSSSPIGGSDKYLSVSIDNGGTWGPVFLSNSASFLRIMGPIPGTNAWVNCQPSEWGCPTQLMKASFLLPDDYRDLKLKIYASVDNHGEFTLNGNSILNCDDVACITGRDVSVAEFAKPGINVIQLKIVDYGFEMGANFKYQFSFRSSQPASVLEPKLYKFAPISSPTVAGSHTLDSVVSASISPTPLGATAKYEWLRDSQVIPGAQDATYRIVAEDVGKKLSFRATFSKNLYEELSVSSTPVMMRSNLPQLNPENGHYYQFFPFSGNWYEVLVSARSKEFIGMRGHLSTITSVGENRFVTSLADGNVVFLPSHLTNRSGRNLWVWADGPEAGSPISYCSGPNNCTSANGAFSQWDSELNQPDMQGEPVLVSRTREVWSSESNVSRIENGAWGDCSLTCARGIVVEFEPNWKTFLSDDLIQSGPNHFYQLIQERVNYNQALANARNFYFKGIRGHLVTVESSVENSLVSQLASGKSFWLAGRDVGDTSLGQRNWIWDDGPSSGKQFLTCRSATGCVSDSVDISSWAINMSHLNGSGNWENALQGGGLDNWEMLNDCAPTIEQCGQVNSYIVEYELNPKSSVINQYGDWLSLSSNIALPGQQVLVSSHFESAPGYSLLTSSGNPSILMAPQDSTGSSTTTLSFATSGLKSVSLSLGKKKFSLKIWVPKLVVERRSVKVGKSFTVSLTTVAPGTNCKVLTSDGRVFESVSNAIGKASFTIPSTKIGALVLSVFAGNVELDSQGLTVLR